MFDVVVILASSLHEESIQEVARKEIKRERDFIWKIRGKNYMDVRKLLREREHVQFSRGVELKSMKLHV